MKKGWVKVYRSLNDHELLAHDNSAYIVFTKLLLEADRTTGKYTTGRYRLAELTNLKPMTAWDALKRLEKAKMVVIKSDNKKSIITICNWHKYQDTTDTSSVIKPSSNRHQTVTKQEDKNKELRIKKPNKKTSKKEIIKTSEPDPQVVGVIQHFENKIGKMRREKYQAKAAKELLQEHGFDKVRGYINAAAMVRGEQYAPSISNLEELSEKWIKLENFFRRQQAKSKGIVRA